MTPMKKKNKKNVPQMSPFQRKNARDVGELLKEGVDPLTVRQQSIGGERHYTYKDIAHYYELTKKPFIFNLSQEKVIV